MKNNLPLNKARLHLIHSRRTFIIKILNRYYRKNRKKSLSNKIVFTNLGNIYLVIKLKSCLNLKQIQISMNSFHSYTLMSIKHSTQTQDYKENVVILKYLFKEF
jgi:hypothetical protein